MGVFLLAALLMGVSLGLMLWDKLLMFFGADFGCLLDWQLWILDPSWQLGAENLAIEIVDHPCIGTAANWSFIQVRVLLFLVCFFLVLYSLCRVLFGITGLGEEGEGEVTNRTCARIFREMGARVRFNTFLRDMDVGVSVNDPIRIEVMSQDLSRSHSSIVQVWCLQISMKMMWTGLSSAQSRGTSHFHFWCRVLPPALKTTFRRCQRNYWRHHHSQYFSNLKTCTGTRSRVHH